MENYQHENQNQPAQTEKKNRKPISVLTIVLSAVAALICGCLGSYIVNSVTGRVVIQQSVSDESADGEASTGSGDGTSATDVGAAISATVVSITTEKMEVSQFWFGTQVSSGAGSGVIISEDGYILTYAM